MMHDKAAHRNWLPADRHYVLYEDMVFLVPESSFLHSEDRDAASLDGRNIYPAKYVGHYLNIVTCIDSDTLLYDPWPHAFLETMTPAERQRFFAAYRDRNNDSYTTVRSEKEKAICKFQRYMQD